MEPHSKLTNELTYQPHYLAIPLTQPRRPKRVSFGTAVAACALISFGLFSLHSCNKNMTTPSESGRVSRIPDDVSIVSCSDWTLDEPTGRYSNSAKASYTLPVDSAKLFVYSDGPLAHGSINFLTSESDAEDDLIHVEVFVSYHDPIILTHSKVCSLQGVQPNAAGVGIVTETMHRRDHRWEFTIFVRFPKPTAASTPLQIQEFETDLNIFVHHFGDLGRDITFKRLKLRTANVPIKVLSAKGDVIEVETMNSPISGSFNTSYSLKLTTSNAGIDIAAHLFNSDESKPTTLVATTMNAPIKAAITLTSAHTTGGAFDVDATTSAGGMDLGVIDAPVDHILRLKGQNSFSPAKASLPKSYEGTFEGSTSWSGVNVHYNDHAEDPAGKERKRQMTFRYVDRRSRMAGNVFWSEEGRERGSVELSSSFSPVEINF